jgi:uncharacterized protein
MITGPAVAAGPSFSCSGNLSETETVICSDDQLAQIDRELDNVYARRLDKASRDDVEALRAEQKAWLARRNRCHFDQSCIRRAYADRLNELASRPTVVQPKNPVPAAPSGACGSDQITCAAWCDKYAPDPHSCKYTSPKSCIALRGNVHWCTNDRPPDN